MRRSRKPDTISSWSVDRRSFLPLRTLSSSHLPIRPVHPCPLRPRTPRPLSLQTRTLGSDLCSYVSTALSFFVCDQITALTLTSPADGLVRAEQACARVDRRLGRADPPSAQDADPAQDRLVHAPGRKGKRTRQGRQSSRRRMALVRTRHRKEGPSALLSYRDGFDADRLTDHLGFGLCRAEEGRQGACPQVRCDVRPDRS